MKQQTWVLAVLTVLGVVLAVLTHSTTPTWITALSWALWGCAIGANVTSIFITRRNNADQ